MVSFVDDFCETLEDLGERSFEDGVVNVYYL